MQESKKSKNLTNYFWKNSLFALKAFVAQATSNALDRRSRVRRSAQAEIMWRLRAINGANIG